MLVGAQGGLLAWAAAAGGCAWPARAAMIVVLALSQNSGSTWAFLTIAARKVLRFAFLELVGVQGLGDGERRLGKGCGVPGQGVDPVGFAKDGLRRGVDLAAWCRR